MKRKEIERTDAATRIENPIRIQYTIAPTTIIFFNKTRSFLYEFVLYDPFKEERER
jgi:hypothetical protein